MKNHYILYGVLFALLSYEVGRADNYVIINQVMYDTPLNEMPSISPANDGEFIELYNAGTSAVSLQGWQLSGGGATEKWTFSNITLPENGFLIVACRRGASTFQLQNLYTLPSNSNYTVVYQNKIVLANEGETLTLCNAENDTIDQMYYDGESHLSNPNRLYAKNEDNTPGDSCFSLHRTWVEFDADGKAVSGTGQWQAGLVTFAHSVLPNNSYYEDHLIGGQGLPTGENYILSVSPLDPATRIDVNDGNISICNGVRVRTTIQYMDGLGRENERIELAATPGKNDLVTTADYRGKRKVSRQWLPVVVQTEGQRVDIADVQLQAQTDYSDNRPFYETRYENTAQRRLVAKVQPGESFENHENSQNYSFNSDADHVRIYTIGNNSLHTDGTYYEESTLYKTTSIDEDGKNVITYTDKSGHGIMEERNGQRTYYVYDDLDRLRFVLPNISSTKLNNGNYTLNDSTLKRMAYCYQYDQRGSMIYKRIPGCEPLLMVYDQLGQLVLKQDGNQRISSKWSMFAYDSIGRNLYTVEMPLSQTHDQLISFFADKWQVEHYGNNTSNIITGTYYASTLLGKNNLRLLIFNYYDDYDYLSKLPTPLRNTLKFSQQQGYGTQHDNATGLLTTTRVYDLSENSYTTTTYFYDAKGRVVQSRSARSNDDYTVTSIAYLFDGSVARQKTVHVKGEEQVCEHYRYAYDHAGRLQKVHYQLNNDAEIVLSAFSYDSIGRLVQNLLHNNRDNIQYSYDMRNMLTELHNKHFSERLFYADNPSVNTCYNGNISAAQISQGDSTYTFGYTYDAFNRLIESERLVGSAQLPSEKFGYDASGNITSLQRYNGGQLIDDLVYDYGNEGHQLWSITDIGQDADMYDVMEYHNGITSADTTMRYDVNGNLIYDADRGISVIHYNMLNLPDTIQFVNGNQVVNLYDASGKKYKSIIYTNIASAITPRYEIVHYTFNTDSVEFLVTEYAGSVERQYTRRDTTQRVHNTIGYYTDSTYYHYVKDHLGNVCAVVESAKDSLVQGTIYYPSGVPMSQSFGRDVQPYLYNGKEFVEAHGWNTYDYGFRGYYAPIGRFTSIDPLAEQTPWYSPYSYAGNRFVNSIDWMGLGVVNFTTPHCIVLGPDMTVQGIYDDGDDWIYIDETGNWKEGDSKDNLIKYLKMTAPIEWYIAIYTGANGSGGLSGTTCQSDATNIPTTVVVYSQKMSHDVYIESLRKKNDPATLPSDMERYMQNIPEQDRLLITNPLIQLSAILVAVPYVIEEGKLIYITTEKYNIAQFFEGLIEGWEKGKLGAGPDVPYLYESPLFQVGSNVGSWLYQIIYE